MAGNNNGNAGGASRFFAAVVLVVLCTVVAAVVSTAISQAAFDDPSIVQEISVSVLLCAGALWALVIVVWMRGR